jgi:hypothetical protein
MENVNQTTELSTVMPVVEDVAGQGGLANDYVHNHFEMSRDDIVYLPIGLKHEGTVVRTVTLKEPDGYTEELQTSQNYRKHLATIVNATLIDCIVAIEGLEIPSNPKKANEFKESFVQNLSEPDRQYLMLRLYRLEHGDKFEMNTQCTKCGAKHNANIDLRNDLNIDYIIEEQIDPSFDDRMIIRDVQLEHPITVGGQQYNVINVRIPNGLTSHSLEKMDNIGQMTTKLLFGMLLVNQDKFIPTENEVKRWSKKVRNGIVEAIADRRKGFVNEFVQSCESCDSKFETRINVAEFLGK